MEKNILKSNIAIILVEPQLGENIGTTARAMLNFGFENLILVNPRDDWPNDYAKNLLQGQLKLLIEQRSLKILRKRFLILILLFQQQFDQGIWLSKSMG